MVVRAIHVSVNDFEIHVEYYCSGLYCIYIYNSQDEQPTGSTLPRKGRLLMNIYETPRHIVYMAESMFPLG